MYKSYCVQLHLISDQLRAWIIKWIDKERKECMKFSFFLYLSHSLFLSISLPSPSSLPQAPTPTRSSTRSNPCPRWATVSSRIPRTRLRSISSRSRRSIWFQWPRFSAPTPPRPTNRNWRRSSPTPWRFRPTFSPSSTRTTWNRAGC